MMLGIPKATNPVGNVGQQISQLSDASMPVIFSAVLAEPVNAITISVDNEGNPFSIKRAELNILVPAGSGVPDGTSTNLYGRINDITSLYQDSWMGWPAPFMFYGFVRNAYSQINTLTNVLAGVMTQFSRSFTRDETPTYIAINPASARFSGVEDISKLDLWLNGDYVFPIGTVFQLRGQKA